MSNESSKQEYIDYICYIEHLKKTFHIYDTNHKNNNITYIWYYYDINNKFISIEITNGIYTVINQYYIRSYMYVDGSCTSTFYNMSELQNFININTELIQLSQKNYIESTANIKIINKIFSKYIHTHSYGGFTYFWKLNNTLISIHYFQNIFFINNDTYYTYNTFIPFLKTFLKSCDKISSKNIDALSSTFSTLSINKPINKPINNTPDDLSLQFSNLSITNPENNLFIPLSKEDRLYYQSCKKVDLYATMI